MADQNPTRLLLRTSLKLMVLASVVAFGWVLFGSLPESDVSVAEVVRYNVADMQPGEHRLVEWQKKPLFIVHRKTAWEEALSAAETSLYHDPDSRDSSQSDAATNPLRSAYEGWFVTLGLGTGMGCTLVFSAPDSRLSGFRSAGGYVDSCDQSYYDLAGKVYVGQQARRNTVIPPWSIKDNEISVGGQ